MLCLASTCGVLGLYRPYIVGPISCSPTANVVVEGIYTLDNYRIVYGSELCSFHEDSRRDFRRRKAFDAHLPTQQQKCNICTINRGLPSAREGGDSRSLQLQQYLLHLFSPTRCLIAFKETPARSYDLSLFSCFICVGALSVVYTAALRWCPNSACSLALGPSEHRLHLQANLVPTGTFISVRS